MRIRAARARSAWKTWWATCGSGPTNILDDHTRAGILRGGSHYQPQGSHWYFPQAYKLNEHGKYLLIAPAKTVPARWDSVASSTASKRGKTVLLLTVRS